MCVYLDAGGFELPVPVGMDTTPSAVLLKDGGTASCYVTSQHVSLSCQSMA